MKDKLIIIHGANALSSNNKHLQKLISFMYKYICNFIPEYNLKNPWVNVFSKSKYDIIELKWSGRIIPYDVSKTSKKLSELINLNPNENYFFLTESIGAEIAFSAIEKSNAKNIKKVISICPVNKPRNIKHFSAILLKSNSDIFAKFSNKVLWPLHFFKSMTGNIKDICLERIRHDQFVPSYKINKNQTLLELIENKMNGL